ncbi:hypothetical protein, partial [Klebsiella pneumoniae]|uniref:hypothetical protein n=1 Tax=Klebsiella pneumoniae TaxID=573 RepID=UPI00272F79BD
RHRNSGGAPGFGIDEIGSGTRLLDEEHIPAELCFLLAQWQITTPVPHHDVACRQLRTERPRGALR